MLQGSVSVRTFPSIWDNSMYTKHKGEKPWLDCKDGFLGCLDCRAVKDSPSLVKEIESHELELNRTIRLAGQWTDYTVTYSGQNRKQQLNSLRKKLHDHSNSAAHKAAVAINKKADANIISKSLNKVSGRALSTTSRCFRTVYKMGTSARPFTDYPMSIELQELNGLDMGRILHSNVVAKDIACFISEQMKAEMVKNIVKSEKPFSILLDESTSLSVKATLIIYIRHAFGDNSPVTIMLDLVELDSKSAQGICDTLYAALERYGLTAEILSRRWLGLTTDGCSTMLGRVGGLHALVKEKYPHVISWHCVAHRLELSVNDALKSVNATNHFKSFLDEIYKLYSMSTKNKTQLENIAKSFGTELSKVGKVFTIRWVASSFKTISAVWKSYDSLASHFQAASKDESRSSTERQKFSSLLNHLLSVDFVMAMAIMLDVLEELSECSLALQANSMTISEAHRKLTLTCRVLSSFKEKPGPYEEKIQSKFENHALKANVKGITKLPKNQFIQAIVDSLNSRMFTSAGSKSYFYDKLVSALNTLSPSSWSETDLEDVTFGDRSIEFLAETLRISSTRTQVVKFRDFVDSGGKRNEHMSELTSVVSTIAVSSAECERGFRAMNGIMTKYRASLNTETLSCLLFLHTACPPLSLYNPEPHAKLWIRQGRHSAIDANAMSKSYHDFTNHEKKGV